MVLTNVVVQEHVQPVSARRAFLTVLLLGSLLSVLSFVVSLAWGVFRLDILHTNPHRSAAGAILMAVPMGTIIGIIMTIGHFSLGLLVAAGAVAAAARRYGFIPLWVLVVLVPLMTLAIFIQHNALPDVFDRRDGLETPLPPLIIALNLSPHLWSALLICWFWLRRGATHGFARSLT